MKNQYKNMENHNIEIWEKWFARIPTNLYCGGNGGNRGSGGSGGSGGNRGNRGSGGNWYPNPFSQKQYRVKKLEKQFKDAILAYRSGFVLKSEGSRIEKCVRKKYLIGKISSSSGDAVMSEFLWGWLLHPGIST